jgi:hypothetical protein
VEQTGMIIDLPRQIDPDLAADLEKESAFVSPLPQSPSGDRRPQHR